MNRTHAKAKRHHLACALAIAAGLGTALLDASTALASDPPGKAKAEQICAACHGAGGDRPVMPGTPRLAGQQYDYVVQVLSDFRQGTRDSPIMGAVAKSLTDKEIRDLAAYYSDQKGLTVKR